MGIIKRTKTYVVYSNGTKRALTKKGRVRKKRCVK